MKKYLTYRSILLLGTLVGSLYTSGIIINEPAQTASLTYKATQAHSFAVAQSIKAAPPKAAGSAETAETQPENPIAELSVKGITISFGESKDSIIKKFGTPNRIVDTEYDFDYYVYNNNYKELLFIALQASKVVGYYTDSVDFIFKGITSGSDILSVNKALGKSFPLAEVLTQSTEQYTLKVLMDKLDTQKVTGVYLLSNTVKLDDYSDSAMRNTELLLFDLTNSVRARNGVAVLSWSSSAAIASRKHSVDMAAKHYFDHLDTLGSNPGDRMNEEGIFYLTSAENIIAGYGTAILSNHGWFNSKEHRNNMLNAKFRYLGVGFSYQADSPYKTYFTQDFYR